jgi:hypothetical protein
MAGRIPDDLLLEFVEDTLSMSTRELGEKYKRAQSTIREWRTYARGLGYGVGYGTGEVDNKRPEIEGVTADDEVPIEKLWESAEKIQEITEKKLELRNTQFINLPNKPCAIALLSDIHFGSPNTDYKSAKRDAEIVRDTDGMWAEFHGDGVDNWIIGKLQAQSKNQPMTIDAEWRLFIDWIEMIGEKLLWCVPGNHENWAYMIAGVDRVKQALSGTRVLYDPYEVVVTLSVGPASWVIKTRHKWRYQTTVFNDSHGLQVGWERGDTDYDIGIGGHTHTGTFFTAFVRHRKRRLAAITGSYKVDDGYGRQLGVRSTSGLGSGAIVFHPNGKYAFFDDLEVAADFLEFWRG